MDSRDLCSLRSLRHENDGFGGCLLLVAKVHDLQPPERKLVILDLVSERSERRVSGIHASTPPPRCIGDPQDVRAHRRPSKFYSAHSAAFIRSARTCSSG